MPQYIVKLKDRYAMWSTIVDAPITNFVPLDEFTAWYRDRFGSEGMKTLPERLTRVEANGTSALDETLNDVINCNRAGEGERCLSHDELFERYTPAAL